MYILYPPSSYSGVTSMIHMKLVDKRFAKTVPMWTYLKLVFFSKGSLSFKLEEIVLQERVALGKKNSRCSQVL